MRRPIYCSICLATIVIGCSKSENSSTATQAAPTATLSSSSSPSRGNAIRGQLVSVSDSVLTVSSRDGNDVQVKIDQPIEVYSRVPAKLSDVKPNSFVGITSVPQADGSLHATEIHIFPEKLRGTNEGSFLMGQRGGGQGGNGNRMTNGTVAAPSGGSGNRMTNGTVGAQSGNTVTVRFQNDSQTIVIPANVTVTEIAKTNTKLTPGMNVVIQTTRASDGTLNASTVMLSPPRPTG